MPLPDDWHTAARLLCVRLDTMGDILMTTPAIRALKAAAPGRRIVLLTSRAGAEVASLVPEIDDILVLQAPWMKSADAPDGAAVYAMAEHLRSLRLDAAVIFTVYSQSPLPAALLCVLAGIPLRLAHCRENPYHLLTRWVPEPEPERLVRHEVRRQLDLVAQIGCRTADERLSLRVPPWARRRIAHHLRALGIDPSGRWVIIHPGASAPSRRYPAESFAQAARLLRQRLGCPLVLTGTRAEQPITESIQAAAPGACASLAGRLSVAELAALFAAAPLVIANNSGPAHLAAAVGTPVVNLYALTNPQHTPWGVPSRVLSHDVPCKFCYRSICPEGHHDCLRRVSPDAVAEAADELLAGRAARVAHELPDALASV